ncbi:VOC family protein [Bordetella petrii]|uniref:VOC family protein n=1 Tax=Bordetella petrii TaxID=94624 RepID=UPI00372F0077
MPATVPPTGALPAVTPFLMFEGQAEEAVNWYMSLFPGSAMRHIQRYGPEGPGREGSIVQARFELNGREFMCIDSPAKHAFGFTPAISLFVDCESAAEVDRLYAAFSDGGTVLMPLDAYPFSPRFAWVQDKYGVSWQLHQPPGA